MDVTADFNTTQLSTYVVNYGIELRLKILERKAAALQKILAIISEQDPNYQRTLQEYLDVLNGISFMNPDTMMIAASSSSSSSSMYIYGVCRTSDGC